MAFSSSLVDEVKGSGGSGVTSRRGSPVRRSWRGGAAMVVTEVETHGLGAEVLEGHGFATTREISFDVTVLEEMRSQVDDMAVLSDVGI